MLIDGNATQSQSSGSNLVRSESILAKLLRQPAALRPAPAGQLAGAAGSSHMEGPSVIRNYNTMGKRKYAYPASSEEAVAAAGNPSVRLALALLLLLVVVVIAFFVWRRARNRGPQCAPRTT